MKKHKLPTVALHMIVKDEKDRVDDMLHELATKHQVFDEIVITVSDKKTYEYLNSAYGKEFKIDHREWTDDFSAARNHNMKLSDTDFYFWIDADDKFDFSTIPKLVAFADANQYDAIYLPYNYATDQYGNTVAYHERERLIRRSRGFEWRGVLHETMIPADEGTFRGKKLKEPAVIHDTPDVEASKERNHEILRKAVEGKAADEVDPRDVYYYGLSLFGMGKYEGSINVLESYIRLSGWPEEQYRALVKIGEAYFMMDKHAEATEYTLKASALMPELAEAYFALARYMYALARWGDVLQWLEVAYSKPKYEGMSVQNPEVYELAKIYSAVSHYELGHYKQAYQHLMAAPEYLRKDLEQAFQVQSELEAFYELAPNLVAFLGAESLWNATPDMIRYDKRMKWLRDKVVTPKQWPKNSVVFYCGSAYEEWGAHTLSKGMGGSEEAVVYLSRELAKQGYDVTIYGHVSERIEDTDFQDDWDHETTYRVNYIPYKEFDERDKFDIFVAWRSPEYADDIEARKKIIDVHDLLNTRIVTPRKDGSTYFVKTNYHRSLYPDVPDDQIHVIGNGIKKEHFAVPQEKKKHSVGYFSAYYRGLEHLLKLWPAIRKEVPDATLDVYYGWESWIKINDKDDFYHRMEKKFEELKDQGVTVHGRVSHGDLAVAMGKTQVWAYPTEFQEIHCITALKAQEAHCYPVTTDVAALAETVQSGAKIETDTIYSDQYQSEKFIEEVVDALKNEKLGTPVDGVDWSDVARDWIKFFEGAK